MAEAGEENADQQRRFGSIHQHTYYILIPSIYTNQLNIATPIKRQPNALRPIKLYHFNSGQTTSHAKIY